MQDDGQPQPGSVWPMPQFHFVLTVEDTSMVFQEASGLDIETEVLEYRAGNSPVFSKIKMPGLQKTANVTLKKGLVAQHSALFDWFNEIKLNTITRKSVTITLRDGNDAITMAWTLHNAFPVKVTAADFDAMRNEFAVENVEIAHEGLTITNT
ncbi:phage tail protein [Tateyamaria sp. SN6-1]|uniref:phage tail protein n=1 Tax=Tateyamaria sp. SN6-1 TaxID=3092148 RepID=UPI0039F501E1